MLRLVNAEEPLPGDDFIRVAPGEKNVQADSEKIDFPAVVGPVPTFEAAFGYNDDDEPPPPPGSRTLGPRFYMQANVPLTVDASQLAGPMPINSDSFTHNYT